MTDKDRVERAMQDPAREFTSPEAVLSEASLRPAHKRSILERWRQRLGGEHSEPASGETDLATRIGRALAMLDTETGAHETSHDQGFYTSIGDIGKK
ncbi:MAG: hypothetical protein AB7I59_30360 [Geminicoccaceae bacterium]